MTTYTVPCSCGSVVVIALTPDGSAWMGCCPVCYNVYSLTPGRVEEMFKEEKQ
jgi:hypothetical protein